LESEPPQSESLPSLIFFQSLSGELILILVIMICLLVFLSMVSSFERAFHTLDSDSVKQLKNRNAEKGKIIQRFLDSPQRLTATLLVSASLTQVSIALLISYGLGKLIFFDQLAKYFAQVDHTGTFSQAEPVLTGHILHVILTILISGFLLVFFSESLAKRYGIAKNEDVVFRLIPFFKGLNTVLKPFTIAIAGGSGWLDSRMDLLKSRFMPGNKDDLDKAIELSVSESNRGEEELDILKSILTFNDVSVKQVMKPRMDVVALDHEADFEEVLEVVKDSGFSRIPVYREDFDNVFAILYVKDLLAHLDKSGDFEWQKTLRKNVLFVPESKKIKDLLKEFQSKHMHLAIVVDEYGGSAGIVTMEDILEEIFGDIRDEFDEVDEVHAEKIDDDTFIFEGKTLLNDVCRIIGEDTAIFDDIKGESDSIAGMLLEIIGDIPNEDQEIRFKQFTFIPLAVTDRRVERVKLCRNS
jgi:putative hemolysin